MAKNRHQRRAEQKARPATPDQLAAAINAQWSTMRECFARVVALGDFLRAQFGLPLPAGCMPIPPAPPPPAPTEPAK